MDATITVMTAPSPRPHRGADLAAPRLRTGPQRGLFDNPVSAFSIEELTGTVRRIGGRSPELPVTRLTEEVLDELAIKPTRRATRCAPGPAPHATSSMTKTPSRRL